MLLGTARAIVQLSIILHAGCNGLGNAIITFFTPFNPAPCHKLFRTPDPLSAFRGGSGHKTRV